MNRLMLFAALLLAAAGAQATTWFKCLPRDVFPTMEGTPAVFFETTKVEGRLGWCRTDDPTPNGGPSWRLVPYQFCVKAVACNLAGVNPWRVLDQIRSAPDVLAAASAVASTLRVPIVPGSQEATDVAIWWARACRYMTTPPYPAPPPVVTDQTVFPVDYCPSEPVQPPQPVQVWKTVGGTIFTYSAGRLTGITSRKAAAGLDCDLSVAKATAGTRVYAAIMGASPNEATECAQR